MYNKVSMDHGNTYWRCPSPRPLDQEVNIIRQRLLGTLEDMMGDKAQIMSRWETLKV